MDPAFATPDEIAAGYDVAAEEYVRDYYDELTRKPFDREVLRRFAAAVAGKGLVADIGCGPGHVARFLADHGVEMCGIDLSPAMVAAARRLNPAIEFAVGNMLALGLDEHTLAGITAFYSLIHIRRDMVPTAMREYHRVLRPGGWLLLAAHGGEGELHRDSWSDQPVNISITLFQLDELVAHATGVGFTIVEAVARPPYESEHQTERLYVRGRATPE
jgi:SAM-dependent methyltransferase